MANLTPYPTDLNTPCQVLLSKFTASPASAKEMVHASYQIVGVGLGNAVPDGGAGGMKGLACPSDDECKKALEDACKMHGAFGDWIKAHPEVFQTILTLALRLLGSH